MRLAYQKLGKGSNLIILHGLFGMSDNWLSIARRLAPIHTVYLVDQRNHGHSPHAPELNYDLMARDLAQFAADHRLESFALLGHSMGGKTALFFADRYPQFVSHLIIADIAFREYRHAYFRNYVDAMMTMDLQKITSRKEADQTLQTMIQNAAIRQFLLKNLERTADHRFKWRFNLPVISRSLEQVMEAYRPQRPYPGPTLFLRGKLSDYIQQEDMEQIREYFPQAKITTIPEAGHWLHAEAPDVFVKHVTEFIKG